jgi:hypothetical protein
MPTIDELCDLDARIVFFPVRHHSPACARRVVELARKMKPAAVLIEGPSDFNARLDELFLPHRLPIAIYSYVRMPDNRRRGAYYPFCIYSPEWQALLVAKELGAVVRFIDLPWADVAREEAGTNRYADHGLRRGEYIKRLCQETGVENFDDLWDRYFELEADLDLGAFLKRCHHFCLHTRLLDEQIGISDRRREAFMTQQVRAAMEEYSGRILVVTGGYHSSAIHGRLTGTPVAGTDFPTSYESEKPSEGAELGIALTPYSYERLDSLHGYDAGMPNPGFYHQVWQDRSVRRGASHRRLLSVVVGALRKRGQQISAADLIAVESTARGLAQLRGHDVVWRQDLVDGIIGALIKEERAYGLGHPLLDAVHEVFRGGERGVLAAGTLLPPLVEDLREQLAQFGLEPQTKEREIELDLDRDRDRHSSRLMHRVRILAVAGYDRTGGSNLLSRDDLSKLWERWRICWAPDYEATTIEAARYGPTLADAVAARLIERSNGCERNAEAAAILLLDASFAGLTNLADEFLKRLGELIRGDSDFFTVTRSLGHLIYLYIHDHILQTAGRPDLAALVLETFTRALWLLESLGQTSGRDKELLKGMQNLLVTFERCSSSLNLNRDEFVAVMQRVSMEKRQTPVARGAAMGVLWTIGEADAEQVLAQLLLFANPECLGDFLTGLFCMAREAVQRDRELVMSIDRLLVAYADEEFMTALPSLRLAFTYFTPREKHHLGATLLEALGMKSQRSLTRLEVSPETMAQAVAFESRIFEAVKRYGLRGGDS